MGPSRASILAGMISLFRSRQPRPIGIACAVPLLLFLFVGKSYHAAGTIPIALAQGLMAISRLKRPTLRPGLEILSWLLACSNSSRSFSSSFRSPNDLSRSSLHPSAATWSSSRPTTAFRERSRSMACKCPSRCRESTTERLLLAAEQPHGHQCAHG